MANQLSAIDYTTEFWLRGKGEFSTGFDVWLEDKIKKLTKRERELRANKWHQS